MLESKKDMKEHKYGAAKRRVRELKKGMLPNMTYDEQYNRIDEVWSEFGLDNPEELRQYLNHHGISCHGRCNKKNDQNRRVPGYRKMKQNKFEKDRKKMEYRISRQEATFA